MQTKTIILFLEWSVFWFYLHKVWLQCKKHMHKIFWLGMDSTNQSTNTNFIKLLLNYLYKNKDM